jgi:hypothetical protein
MKLTPLHIQESRLIKKAIQECKLNANVVYHEACQTMYQNKPKLNKDGYKQAINAIV